MISSAGHNSNGIGILHISVSSILWSGPFLCVWQEIRVTFGKSRVCSSLEAYTFLFLQHLSCQLSLKGNPFSYSFEWHLYPRIFFGKNFKPQRKHQRQRYLHMSFHKQQQGWVYGSQFSAFSVLSSFSTHLALEIFVFVKSLKKKDVNVMAVLKYFFFIKRTTKHAVFMWDLNGKNSYIWVSFLA